MSGHSLRPSDVSERGGGGPATSPVASRDGLEPLSRHRGGDESPLFIAPLVVWLLVQLAALAVAAARVPLAAQYPQPGEFQAVQVMLAVQFAALALLFPWMMRTVASALAVIGSGWAMLIAAGVLSASPIPELMPRGAFFSIWAVIFLTLARLRLRPKMQSALSSLAIAYVLGGPLLWYLEMEFSAAPVESPGLDFGPLLAALSTSHHFSPPTWIGTLGIELIALLVWRVRGHAAKIDRTQQYSSK